MRAILVANPKGGCGKTTLAVNLASYLANQNERVYLWDLDRQRSALEWLNLRPASFPAIRRLDQQDDTHLPKLKGDGAWMILDSAAGLHGKNLAHAVRLAHKILVPVQPSAFDMAATQDFLDGLMEEKAVRKHRTFIGVVGMRVDPRTRAATTLEQFLQQYDLPVLTYLRDTMVYVNAAFAGEGIFDLPHYVSDRDREQWGPVIEWVRE
ncbi:MAG: ParA family protein [Betaproteobacteria bacterium]|nr:ParA family protein [Betaproteobacteria bacterium]